MSEDPEPERDRFEAELAFERALHQVVAATPATTADYSSTVWA